MRVSSSTCATSVIRYLISTTCSPGSRYAAADARSVPSIGERRAPVSTPSTTKAVSSGCSRLVPYFTGSARVKVPPLEVVSETRSKTSTMRRSSSPTDSARLTSTLAAASSFFTCSVATTNSPRQLVADPLRQSTATSPGVTAIAPSTIASNVKTMAIGARTLTGPTRRPKFSSRSNTLASAAHRGVCYGGSGVSTASAGRCSADDSASLVVTDAPSVAECHSRRGAPQCAKHAGTYGDETG